MSHATQIDVSILLPGLIMDERQERTDDLEFSLERENDGFSYIENETKVIYSIDRAKIIDLDGIQVDVNNVLTEKLFCFNYLQEIGGNCTPQ